LATHLCLAHDYRAKLGDVEAAIRIEADSSKPQLPELFCDRSLGRIDVPSRLRTVRPIVIARR
jgi:hypothetical protein